MQVDFAQQNFFFVVRSFGQHAAEWVAEKRASPKLKALSGRGLASNIAGLISDTIYHTDINAIRNRVRPLNGAPGIVLGRTELSFLVGYH